MGIDLLVPVTLNAVKPNTPYYMQLPMQMHMFQPVVFDPAVNWSTIEEFTRKKAIWQTAG